MSDNISIKTGAIYIRVSTDKQEELSPDAQRRLLLEYTKKNFINVPAEFMFQDDGISGRRAAKRPQFQKMIGFAKDKSHPIDVILVWKFSRFARNQEESIVYKSLLAKNNVEVISISEPLVDGPFGSLIERIIEWMDEYYSIRLSGEVIRGMTENALRGHYQAEPPIGYLFSGNGQPPIKNPDTIIIPTLCHDLFLSGKSPLQIARYLNTGGYRTKKGNPFDSRGVRYILENPFYAGKVRWNYSERNRSGHKPKSEQVYSDGNWEPLWNMEDHQLIQEKLSGDNQIHSSYGRKKRDISTVSHWLSGIVVCSSCGRTLASGGCTNGNKAFQCWGYGKGLCQQSHFIQVDLLEEYVINGLKSFLVNDHIDYTMICELDNHNLEFTELTDLLTSLKRKEQRCKDAYLNEVDTLEEYKENRFLIKEKRKETEQKLKELQYKKSSNTNYNPLLQNHISNVIQLIECPDIPLEKKSSSIRSIVDKISFDRKNTSLHFYFKLVI